ncbi:MAG: DUF4363 family protein [Oscillospiraceae bacterium]|nr:DUF4363 family protein [Oscillospiraceae bacterium]
MKSFIVSLIIAALLLLGSFFYMSRLEKISDELYKINASIAEALRNEEYELAQSKIPELESAISDYEIFCASWENHEHIDAMESTIAEMKIYAESRHQSDALAKSNALAFLFEHLPKNSRLKLENIL